MKLPKKYIVLLVAISLYFIGMMAYMVIKNGAAVTDAIATSGVFLLIVVLLFFVLRKKEQLRLQHRLEEEQRLADGNDDDDDDAMKEAERLNP